MRRQLAVTVALTAMLSVLTGVQAAYADTATLVATEDAYTSQGNPNGTHASTSLTVNAAPGERRAYLKVTVTGIPAGSSEVTARLRLRALSSSAAVFTAWRVGSSWSQSTLTWNNQPPLGSAITSATGVVAGQDLELDLSGYVTGSGTWSVAITGSGGAQARFASREAAAGTRPELALGWTPPATPPPSAEDPVVAAAGDVACAPPATRTAGSCHHRDTSDLLVAGDYDAVLPLGDLQYECGQASAYRSVYDPTWGRLKARTHPAVGDNEYSGTGCSTAGASGYFGYFGPAATPRQPGCVSACGGYYSYDVGSWHVVVLNTECSASGVGGCGASSPQGRWLAADLAANPARCTLAYWHRPRFQDNGNLSGSSAYFVQALYDAGAELILTGHEHIYERFAPQTASGAADPARGVRQFIVGTGGKSRHGLSGQAPRNSQARNGSTYGVLALTLHPSSYDWRFVPEAGQTYTDSGTQACH